MYYDYAVVIQTEADQSDNFVDVGGGENAKIQLAADRSKVRKQQKSANKTRTSATTSRTQWHTCTICGDASDGLHFGAIACRACAAFFRRSIARKLQYTCRFDNDCEFAKNCRAICRSCRMAKCYAVGMNPRAVSSEYRYEPKREKSFPAAGEANQDQSPMLLPSRSPSPLPKPVPLHKMHISDEVKAQEADDTSCSSSKQCTASPTSDQQKSDEVHPDERLRQLIESNANTELPPVNLFRHLPVQPMLRQMMLGYARLQRRRDIAFGRLRDFNGTQSRVYVEKKEMNYLAFVGRVKRELDWVAEFLHSFEGFPQMYIHDKILLFRHYWINFMLLERMFDTFRVLGYSDPASADQRLVFHNGDIIDMEKCAFDFHDSAQQPETLNSYRPWFRHSVEMLGPIKQLAPSETEMLFCLAIMLWKLPPDKSAKLSKAGQNTANCQARALYNEMMQYYGTDECQELNPVERVAEMMRLIAFTEKVTMLRNEDIILSKTFQIFKMDIYLEEIFGV